MKHSESYPLQHSPLYNLRRKSKAAQLLYTSVAFLEQLDPSQNYDQFTEQKSDGGERTINAPYEKLKKVQKRLLDLLRRIDKPAWLISSTRGKTYVDNASYHKDNDYVLTIDIRKFYDSCIHKHVYRLFLNTFSMSPDVAWIFAKITTLNMHLPTGAPTSQLVAFHSYSSAFFALHQAAENDGCRFSLYVDDMTFSSVRPINIPRLLGVINGTLHPVGHRIKYTKVKYYEKGRHKIITGSAVDQTGALRVPNKRRLSIIQDFREVLACDRDGQENAVIINRLRGRLNAARVIELEIFPQIYDYVKRTTQRNKNISKAHSLHAD